jgi:hypothetical protein
MDTTKKNKKMCDAFNQTDSIGIDIGEKWTNDFTQNIDLDKFIKQFEEAVKLDKLLREKTIDHNMFCGLPNDLNNVINIKDKLRGFKYGMIGGGSAAILPMILSYFMMSGLLLIVVCCILAYISYLKFNNTCSNKDCSFNLKKHIITQMKNDIIVSIKKIILYLLNKSVYIVKYLSKVINICYHVYSNGIKELIHNLECDMDKSCNLDVDESCNVGE